ncbi:MAG: DUF669 domain-containing protein [Clostridiales bacterium]|nr:DUF669 domain-containing protein [Clostridiales bacterium]
MANIFEKFNQAIDTKGLQDDIKAAAENKTDFAEVTPGNYEVSIKQMELKASKKGDPMLSIQFKILSAGQFKGQLLFYNQVLTTGVGIHNANQLLRSLESDVDVQFQDYVQYNDIINEVFAAVEDSKLEYALEYGENSKGFKTYKITDVFED